MRKDIDFIKDAIVGAVKARKEAARLQNGFEARKQILQALERGEEVNHYRLEWFNASVEKVVKFGQKLCLEFDSLHPDDAASIADLCDILNGALGVIKRAIQDSNQQSAVPPVDNKANL